MDRRWIVTFLAMVTLVVSWTAIGESVAHADTLDFANDPKINISASLIGQKVDQVFAEDPAYVGVRIIPDGLEVSLSAAPTSLETDELASLETSEPSILAAFPLDPASHVNVPFTIRRVTFSAGDLQGAADRVSSDQDRWRSQGITLTSWGADLTTDRVVVSMAQYSDVAAKQITAAYGQIVTVSPDSLNPQGSASRLADTTPWYGGDKIDHTQGGTTTHCTSWFSAKTSSGAAISPTAGHCGTGAWTQNGSTFGAVTSHHFGGSMDGELIPVSSNSAYVWSDPTSTSRHVTSVATSDVVGTLLCTDGYKDKEVCSVRISSTNQTVTYGGQTITGLVFCVQQQFKAAFTPGDSGGPVEATVGSTSTVAVGMILATTGVPYSDGWYMPARTVNSYFNITIKT